MAGLVAYDSSDDEEQEARQVQTGATSNTANKSEETGTVTPQVVPDSNGASHQSLAVEPATNAAEAPQTSQPEPGPSIGPSRPSDQETGDAPDAPDLNTSYTTRLAAVQSLTMPPHPNFSVPPSPPGSPPLAATRKVSHFLSLKRKGVHFNAKLETSSALKNPALAEKLREYAGIDDYDQYASALPEELAVLTSYPPWAYGEQLNATQQRVTERKAKVPRERMAFLPSGGAAAGKAVRR